VVWLLRPQVPHYVVQCPVLWIMLVRVRGSPVPVSRPRRPSAKPDDLWLHAAGRGVRAARCCCGVGDGAFCTRSRRAGVVLQPRAELPHSLRFQKSLSPLPPHSVSYDVHSANLAPRLAPLAGELVGCWQHPRPSTGGSCESCWLLGTGLARTEKLKEQTNPQGGAALHSSCRLACGPWPGPRPIFYLRFPYSPLDQSSPALLGCV